MSVDVVEDGDQLKLGRPRPLFRTGARAQPQIDEFDVTRDGNRFIVVRPDPGAPVAPVNVIVNWAAMLQDKQAN
jgi:hypothetical protein